MDIVWSFTHVTGQSFDYVIFSLVITEMIVELSIQASHWHKHWLVWHSINISIVGLFPLSIGMFLIRPWFLIFIYSFSKQEGRFLGINVWFSWATFNYTMKLHGQAKMSGNDTSGVILLYISKTAGSGSLTSLTWWCFPCSSLSLLQVCLIIPYQPASIMDVRIGEFYPL